MVEDITIWIGSVSSLVIHTIAFVVFFALSMLHIISWSLMLLVLTTVVSLEAIYLAIFIQMTVNRHTKSLAEVEADIDEIQEDVDEIQEDVDEIQEDMEEMSEDLEEMTEDEREELRKSKQAAAIESLTKDVRQLLIDLETLKKRS